MTVTSLRESREFEKRTDGSNELYKYELFSLLLVVKNEIVSYTILPKLKGVFFATEYKHLN